MADNNSDTKTVGERLKALSAGAFMTLRKIEQGGALQARRLGNDSIQLYWRYTHEGKTDRVAIGTYDPSAPPRSLQPTSRGFSVAAAAEACREKALIQQQNRPTGGYREHVAKVQRSHAERKRAEAQASEQTVEKLVDAYCDHLETQERRSHSDARSIFNLHLKAAWPKVASSPAAQLSAEQVTDILRKLIEVQKGRTANKLRSYLRAAYQCALDVNSLATIPDRFKEFKITSNPAALTKRSAEFDRADKRPLSVQDLRIYWKLLQSADGIAGTALRLHLLSGGQRVEQFVKLQRTDVRQDAITIFDAKGRPGQGARTHVVPLIPRAQQELDGLGKTGKYALSTDGGETHVSAATLSKWACDIAETIADFQLKRVRSGVETVLAAAGIPKEIRGQLQSHGLSGVQARHYDGHDYLRQKTDALAMLLQALEAQPS